MRVIAGVKVPCIDCSARCSSRRQAEVFRQVFFAIGQPEREVSCDDYQEPRWRGLEGVRA